MNTRSPTVIGRNIIVVPLTCSIGWPPGWETLGRPKISDPKPRTGCKTLDRIIVKYTNPSSDRSRFFLYVGSGPMIAVSYKYPVTPGSSATLRAVSAHFQIMNFAVSHDKSCAEKRVSHGAQGGLRSRICGFTPLENQKLIAPEINRRSP
jgi:hypothetical protein